MSASTHIVSLRFIWRQLYRAPHKALLNILLTVAMMVAIGWILMTIGLTRVEMDRLMETVEVDIDIVMASPINIHADIGAANYGAFIGKRVVDDILGSGRIVDYELYSGMNIVIGPAQEGMAPAEDIVEDIVGDGDEKRLEGFPFAALVDPAAFFAYMGLPDTDIEYAPYHDARFFDSDWTVARLSRDLIPIVIPADMLEQRGLGFHDTLEYTLDNAGGGMMIIGRFNIVGSYRDVHGLEEALMPLSALEALHEGVGLDMYYITAHFAHDPAQNRDLPAFREEVDAWARRPGAGLVPLRAIFWDEELRLAIAPLEQTLNLLTVLFPVTVAVSLLLAAGFSVLNVFLSARDGAYLRVLGASKRRLCMIFFTRQMFLGLCGLAVGFAVVFVFWGPAAFGGLFLPCAGLYLGGMLAGVVLAALAVAGKKPIELLQVRE